MQSAEYYVNEYGAQYLYSGLFTEAISLADMTGVFCYGFSASCVSTRGI